MKTALMMDMDDGLESVEVELTVSRFDWTQKDHAISVLDRSVYTPVDHKAGCIAYQIEIDGKATNYQVIKHTNEKCWTATNAWDNTRVYGATPVEATSKFLRNIL